MTQSPSFPDKKTIAELTSRMLLGRLATWWDVLAVTNKSKKFDSKKLDDVEAFLRDPRGWSKAYGGPAGAGG